MKTLTLVFIFTFFVYSLLFLFFLSKKSCEAIHLYKQKLILLIFAIHLISILIINYFRNEVGDVMLFSGAGKYFRQNIDFYFIDSDHSQYPFFPFLIFAYIPLNYISETFSFFTFSTLLKIIILLPCLYFISNLIRGKYKNKNLGIQKQLQFLTNPIVYAVILNHGQIDLILLTFLVYSFEKLYGNKLKDVISGAFLYSLSILSKTWSLLFLPTILKHQKNIKKTFLTLMIVFSVLFADIFIYTRSVFGSAFRVVLPAIFKAGGPIGHWGIPFILNILSFDLEIYKKYNLIVFFILFLIIQLFLYFKNNVSIPKINIMTILGIYIIIPNFGIQYLFWIIPFIFLAKEKSLHFKMFIIISSICVLLHYTNILESKSLIPISIIDFSSFTVWLFAVYWFYFKFRYE